jgi:hypothetical protein
MTIKPMKFTVKQTVVVDGHEIASGTYVGQKLSETDIERTKSRNASYFLHLAPLSMNGAAAAVERFDIDVTQLVQKGWIVVT